MASSSPLGLVDWLSFIASFAFVLSLIVALIFVLKRFGGAQRLGGARQINIIENQALGNRQRLVLVRVKDREILLGSSLQQIATLATWSADEVADRGRHQPVGVTPVSASNGAGFGQLLTRLRGRR